MNGVLTTLPARMSILLLLVQAATAGNPSPAQSGFFTTSDGVRLHYLQAGQGRSILFVPGWTMPAWIWEHQIAHFSRHYRVVAFDSRSHGNSERVTEGHYPNRLARDIRELTQHLEAAPDRPGRMVHGSLAGPDRRGAVWDRVAQRGGSG